MSCSSVDGIHERGWNVEFRINPFRVLMIFQVSTNSEGRSNQLYSRQWVHIVEISRETSENVSSMFIRHWMTTTKILPILNQEIIKLKMLHTKKIVLGLIFSRYLENHGRYHIIENKFWESFEYSMNKSWLPAFYLQYFVTENLLERSLIALSTWHKLVFFSQSNLSLKI